MMPKEKAEELIKNMDVIHYMKLRGKNSNSKGLPISMYNSQIKQCALVAVNEILECTIYYFNDNDNFVIYWQEVKKEIELM